MTLQGHTHGRSLCPLSANTSQLQALSSGASGLMEPVSARSPLCAPRALTLAVMGELGGMCQLFMCHCQLHTGEPYLGSVPPRPGIRPAGFAALTGNSLTNTETAPPPPSLPLISQTAKQNPVLSWATTSLKSPSNTPNI